MKRIIKLIIKLVLFIILATYVLAISPALVFLATGHTLLVWVKNDTPFLMCAKGTYREWFNCFNPYRALFTNDD